MRSRPPSTLHRRHRAPPPPPSRHHRRDRVQRLHRDHAGRAVGDPRQLLPHPRHRQGVHHHRPDHGHQVLRRGAGVEPWRPRGEVRRAVDHRGHQADRAPKPGDGAATAPRPSGRLHRRPPAAPQSPATTSTGARPPVARRRRRSTRRRWPDRSQLRRQGPHQHEPVLLRGAGGQRGRYRPAVGRGVGRPRRAPQRPTGLVGYPGNGSAGLRGRRRTPRTARSPASTSTRAARPGEHISAPGDRASSTVTGLTNGTTYSFTVRAVNARPSAPSAAVSVKPTAAATPPTPPRNLRRPGNRKAKLTWAAPASNGGKPISGYNVYKGTLPDGEAASPVNASPLPATTRTTPSPGWPTAHRASSR